MSQSMVLTEEEAMELLAFLIAAARIQLDEPPQYAPMRLLSAAERLSQLVLNRVSPKGHAALETIQTEISQIERGRRLSENSQDLVRLDGLCRTVAQYLVDWTGLAQRSP
jgi:uncharacterized protein DUF6092